MTKLSKEDMINEAAAIIASVDFIEREVGKLLKNLEIEEEKENADYEKIDEIAGKVKSYIIKLKKENLNIDSFLKKYKKIIDSDAIQKVLEKASATK